MLEMDGENRRDSDDSDIDVRHLKELVGFVKGAPKRHPRLALALLICSIVGGVMASLLVPKWWTAEVSILVEKNVPITGVPAHEADRSNDDPMMGAYEQVMRHDNLLALAHDAHLVEIRGKKRSVLGRLMDRITSSLRAKDSGPPDAEIEDALASVLSKKMSVTIGGNTLVISAEWWDAQTAYDLVALAQKKFMDARYSSEVSVISDEIALLEEHAKTARDAVDTSLQQFEQAKVGLGRGAAPATSAAAPSAAQPSAPIGAPSTPRLARVGPDPELARTVEEKRRQIRELEDDRSRRLAEAKSQLSGLQATYTAAHPSVVAAQGRVDALNAEPPQVTQLKNEERQLLSQIADATEKAAGLPPGSVHRAPLPLTRPTTTDPAERLHMNSDSLSVSDPVAGLALSNLQGSIRKYEDYLDRINAAKLKLDVAKAAFKYRYAIFKPAEVPDRPNRGNPVLLIVAGLFLGLIFTVAGPVVADLASGRFIEPWQVKRRLGLPLLGEVMKP